MNIEQLAREAGMEWNSRGGAKVASPIHMARFAALVLAQSEDAKKWREHVEKLDALVAYCPTCCQGFSAKPEMTRDEIIFECGKTAGRNHGR